MSNRAESPVRACPELAEGNLLLSVDETARSSSVVPPFKNREGAGSVVIAQSGPAVVELTSEETGRPP